MRKPTIKTIPKGSVFTLTTGEWSGHYIIILCKALVNIDPKKLEKLYLDEHPLQRAYDGLDTTKLISWLINEKKYVEKIEYHDLHVNDFSAEFNIHS